jgi:hypothetical protein
VIYNGFRLEGERLLIPLEAIYGFVRCRPSSGDEILRIGVPDLMLYKLILIEHNNGTVQLANDIQIEINLPHSIAVPDGRCTDVHIHGVPRMIRVELHDPPTVTRHKPNESDADRAGRLLTSLHSRV